jgi:hydrogenase maturation protease
LQLTDAHSMSVEAVFATLKTLGGTPGRVLIVGCEPASVDDGIGLSIQVERAVAEAVRLVCELIEREYEKGDSDVPGHSRTDRAASSRH